jgi:hypothetical protein
VAEEAKAREKLANVCVRIPYKGYEISISCDDSAGCIDDLARSDIRVYENGLDVTLQVMKSNTTYADAASLKRAMRNIDVLVRTT